MQGRVLTDLENAFRIVGANNSYIQGPPLPGYRLSTTGRGPNKTHTLFAPHIYSGQKFERFHEAGKHLNGLYCLCNR